MTDHAVHIAKSAVRDIRKLTTEAQRQVIEAIEKLSSDPLPHGVEKLSGRPAFFRMRVGRFRVIYSVQPDPRSVVVLVVRDRKDAFKGLHKLDAQLANALIVVADNLLERAATAGAA